MPHFCDSAGLSTLSNVVALQDLDGGIILHLHQRDDRIFGLVMAVHKWHIPSITSELSDPSNHELHELTNFLRYHQRSSFLQSSLEA